MYRWKSVKMYVMLFKNWKHVFKMLYKWILLAKTFLKLINLVPSYCKRDLSILRMLLNRFVNNYTPTSPKHFHTSMRILSDLMAFPIFILFNTFFYLSHPNSLKKFTGFILHWTTQITPIFYTISIKKFIKIIFLLQFNFLFFYYYYLIFIFNAPNTIQAYNEF